MVRKQVTFINVVFIKVSHAGFDSPGQTILVLCHLLITYKNTAKISFAALKISNA